jgi:uncharacterized membrane protein YqhA
MRTVFGLSRYLVLVAVIGLLLAARAVFVFGGITTDTTVIGAFGHAEFNAEGARALSVELIELIDLFLLGTVLLITSIGLYELFLDPGLGAVIPEWLSVTNLEQLKFNLLAVILVMLAILFLGAAAGEWLEGTTILDYGATIALVVAAVSLAVWAFGRAHRGIEEVKHEALGGSHPAEHDVAQAESHWVPMRRARVMLQATSRLVNAVGIDEVD